MKGCRNVNNNLEIDPSAAALSDCRVGLCRRLRTGHSPGEGNDITVGDWRSV